ncbi:hypothetical protein ASPVEDRAFT_29388 [Aspergillus versicolor CBS 583.65]|uniref:Uncharacterized protein n=1 Tax=Aspergillus versicolor CBS 583.65 TaxID=1036611 RepID=A0A1L9PMT0_ASPVE|nr:uncharacterized protein ASPVEDRAFT_29388 [Aspergillus versicolor CBS 583.65]OJJ02844.1 hypothetical protein ASPVEDRAFT_29388 [Aspergillus versicolor CBS 583.65]
MARPAQTAQSRLTFLLKHWPADPIRPSSVSVQTYLQSRLPQSQSQSPEPSQPAATAAAVPTGTISESSINALTSLLEDRYAKRYPLPPKLRHPASNPDHYDDLIREFEEAPTRDILGRIKKKLGGLFRFQ